ncbi:hypothetical protein SNEBB_006487 [Seison nebaliae]|nr:hypothetical protein SNEBB_006487 [Seison nebaliae]
MSNTKCNKLHIRIISLTGLEIIMRLNSSHTIRSIKEKINQLQGIPITEQNLMFGEKLLENDGNTCSLYGIDNNAELKLVVTTNTGFVNPRRLLTTHIIDDLDDDEDDEDDDIDAKVVTRKLIINGRSIQQQLRQTDDNMSMESISSSPSTVSLLNSLKRTSPPDELFENWITVLLANGLSIDGGNLNYLITTLEDIYEDDDGSDYSKGKRSESTISTERTEITKEEENFGELTDTVSNKANTMVVDTSQRSTTLDKETLRMMETFLDCLNTPHYSMNDRMSIDSNEDSESKFLGLEDIQQMQTEQLKEIDELRDILKNKTSLNYRPIDQLHKKRQSTDIESMEKVLDSNMDVQKMSNDVLLENIAIHHHLLDYYRKNGDTTPTNQLHRVQTHHSVDNQLQSPSASPVKLMRQSKDFPSPNSPKTTIDLYPKMINSFNGENEKRLNCNLFNLTDYKRKQLKRCCFISPKFIFQERSHLFFHQKNLHHQLHDTIRCATITNIGGDNIKFHLNSKRKVLRDREFYSILIPIKFYQNFVMDELNNISTLKSVPGFNECQIRNPVYKVLENVQLNKRKRKLSKIFGEFKRNNSVENCLGIYYLLQCETPIRLENMILQKHMLDENRFYRQLYIAELVTKEKRIDQLKIKYPQILPDNCEESTSCKYLKSGNTNLPLSSVEDLTPTSEDSTPTRSEIPLVVSKSFFQKINDSIEECPFSSLVFNVKTTKSEKEISAEDSDKDTLHNDKVRSNVVSRQRRLSDLNVFDVSSKKVIKKTGTVKKKRIIDDDHSESWINLYSPLHGTKFNRKTTLVKKNFKRKDPILIPSKFGSDSFIQIPIFGRNVPTSSIFNGRCSVEKLEENKTSKSTANKISETFPLSNSNLEIEDEKNVKLLCFECGKKTRIGMYYRCRCNSIFCTRHRNPETHNCQFDYKTEGRKILKKNNPKINSPKLPKI